MPLLRLYVQSPDGTKSGYLCFERTYQTAFSGQAAPNDQWETDNIVAGNYRLWSTGNLPNAGTYYSDSIDLSNWQSTYGNYKVLGVGAGCGSGWGSFASGAVDDITFGFNGASTTYNFEVVPEPGTLALLAAFGLTALGAAWMRRRRSAN